MTVPFPFQREDVDSIDTFNGRCLLASEMGCGKSFISLLYAIENRSLRPIIVVCPASIKWQWSREASIHVNMRSEILEGTRPEEQRIRRDCPLWIINYDILGPWLPFLRDLKPQLVIVDECHRISSNKTLRTKNIRKLVKDVPHVLALSGTPLTNRPAELWPTLNILRPDLYPSFWNFAFSFCSPHKAPWGWMFNGAANLGVLHSQLTKTMMIRRRKEDVLSQLPSKTRTVTPVEINNRKEYTHALTDFLNWLRLKGGRTEEAKKAEQLVKLGYLKRLAAELKLDSVMDWLDDFLSESDDKIIVFGVHRKIIETIHKKYKVQSVLVHGETPGRKRQQAIDQFTNHKSTRMFIGNIQAAGVGWNGTAASTVVFTEIEWSPGLHSQAEDRIHRIGQKNSSNIHYLVARNTIEESLCRLIQQKQTVISQTLDGINGNGMDIFDQLMKEIKRETRRSAART